jgi:hypothetical protein
VSRVLVFHMRLATDELAPYATGKLRWLSVLGGPTLAISMGTYQRWPTACVLGGISLDLAQPVAQAEQLRLTNVRA